MKEGLRILVNGREEEFPSGSKGGDVVARYHLKSNGILFELNGEARLRSEWPGLELRNGDRVELIRVVAGG